MHSKIVIRIFLCLAPWKLKNTKTETTYHVRHLCPRRDNSFPRFQLWYYRVDREKIKLEKVFSVYFVSCKDLERGNNENCCCILHG